jgi:glycerol uptake facilitator-like aquaporin
MESLRARYKNMFDYTVNVKAVMSDAIGTMAFVLLGTGAATLVHFYQPSGARSALLDSFVQLCFGRVDFAHAIVQPSA